MPEFSPSLTPSLPEGTQRVSHDHTARRLLPTSQEEARTQPFWRLWASVSLPVMGLGWIGYTLILNFQHLGLWEINTRCLYAFSPPELHVAEVCSSSLSGSGRSVSPPKNLRIL